MTEKFHFGKNWQSYIKSYFSPEALSASKQRLSTFLPEPLAGKTFIDVGCGSGVHSLAALELGAAEVLSVDADKHSVVCTEELRVASQYGDEWRTQEGSLLGKDFILGLGQYDVVYCWGVAHHTGDMWKALENLTYLVKPGGQLFIAIYNYVEGKRGSRMWHSIKRTYNRSPRFIKKLMEYAYISLSFLLLILHMRNPFKAIREYHQKRGMAWKTDLIDWLGGYPYEYASVEQLFDFYAKRGFELEKIKTTNYIGCNQLLFRKK